MCVCVCIFVIAVNLSLSLFSCSIEFVMIDNKINSSSQLWKCTEFNLKDKFNAILVILLYPIEMYFQI